LIRAVEVAFESIYVSGPEPTEPQLVSYHEASSGKWSSGSCLDPSR